MHQVSSWADAADDERRRGVAFSARVSTLLLGALDVAVVTSVGAVVLYLVAGPFDLGVLSVSKLAKPFLQALVLTSLRVGIGRESWLSHLVLTTTRRAVAAGAAVSRRVGWAQGLYDAVIALVITRVAGKAVGFSVNLLYPTLGPRPFDMPFESEKFFETFAAWDSGWYFDIAQRGYYFRPDGQSSVAFFPLYPMLMRALAWPFGGSDHALWISGIVISYGCFLAALVVLHRMVERISGRREAARRTLLYLAVFPFSFVFSRVYAESLFLLLSVSAVGSAGLGWWRAAGLLGALAALARPNGMLIGIPLGLMALQGVSGWRDVLRRALPLLAIPVAVGLYCLFVYRLSGDPLAWLNAQAHWGYTIGNRPWAAVQQLLERIERLGVYDFLVAEHRSVYSLLHAAAGLAVVALTPSIFARLGLALGAYVAVGILVPLSGNALEGIGRYAATLFPVFMLLGMSTTRRMHDAVLIVGALWLGTMITLFVTLHPVY